MTEITRNPKRMPTGHYWCKYKKSVEPEVVYVKDGRAYFTDGTKLLVSSIDVFYLPKLKQPE